MEIFRKKGNSSQKNKCPNCGAELELDIIRGTGECPYCGTKCNISRSEMGVVDSVISFIERQQERADQKRAIKEQKEREEELQRKEHFRKFWWVYALCFGIIAVTIIVGCVIALV